MPPSSAPARSEKGPKETRAKKGEEEENRMSAILTLLNTEYRSESFRYKKYGADGWAVFFVFSADSAPPMLISATSFEIGIQYVLLPDESGNPVWETLVDARFVPNDRKKIDKQFHVASDSG